MAWEKQSFDGVLWATVMKLRLFLSFKYWITQMWYHWSHRFADLHLHIPCICSAQYWKCRDSFLVCMLSVSVEKKDFNMCIERVHSRIIRHTSCREAHSDESSVNWYILLSACTSQQLPNGHHQGYGKWLLEILQTQCIQCTEKTILNRKVSTSIT